MWRRSTLFILLAGVLLASACGSRLPDQTLEAIDDGLTGSGTRAPAGGTTAGDSGFAAGTTDAAAGETTTAAGAATPTAGGTATATGPATATVGAAADPGVRAAGQTACQPGAATSPGVTPREIKVASIVTDSGPLPGATEGAYRGAAAYFAMINSQGGVCGRKLTLAKGDDGLDPARARGEFLRLEPQVLAFVGAYSVADSGYIDLIEKTKVPYASLTIDPSGRKLPNVWPKRSDDQIQTGPFVYLKQKHPDAVKAAMLYADVGAVEVNVPGTAAAIQRAGFQLVQPPIPVGVADPDYTGTVRNLQDKGVEFIYLFAFEVNMHVRFNRNMRQQGYEPKIKGANIAFNDRFSELTKRDGDGWLNVNLYLPFLDPAEKSRSKEVTDFLTWNQRLFPGEQMDLFNVNGWGQAAFFVEALRRAGGDVNRAELNEALAKNETYDDGGLGAPLDPHNGNLTKCFTMAIHEGGAWKRLHPTTGFDCDLGEVLKFK